MNRCAWFEDESASIVIKGRPFVKMHGLRNDFVIVDARQAAYRPSTTEIVAICDRREGVGADELVVVEPPSADQAGSGVYAFVRIYNPDGREVEACGNATRCVGWLLLEESGAGEIVIATLGGRLACRPAGDGQVAVDMGRLRTDWREIPLSTAMDTLHLGIEVGPLKDPVGMNIGNPHAVFFVEDIDAVDLNRHGPVLQTHPLFPEEANIGVAQLLDSETLKLEVWERPGALTTACGTGACVAVGAAHRRGLTDRKRMTVVMPAGSVVIELDDRQHATMIGPATVCFTGYLPLQSQVGATTV